MNGQSPILGGERRERHPKLWADLLGRDDRRRNQAVKQIGENGQVRWYARQIMDVLREVQKGQRLSAGKALSLLGDLRFSEPLYLSEMLPVPAGEAVMGGNRYPEERPVHRVRVDAFSLSRYPVTQAAYAVFTSETGYHVPRGWKRNQPHPDQLNQPAVFVSAWDAESYCQWLSLKTGFSYRLPTEAEWMLAARGAGGNRPYPWGDSYSNNCLNAWEGQQPFESLCAVGLFPEGRGIYKHDGLAGNIWEWCSSLFWAYPYRKNDGREDPGSDEEKRVLHGGSWRSKRLSVRCAAREGEYPRDGFAVVGFRVARDQSVGDDD